MWQKLFDDQNRPYYYNTVTGQTQWENPGEQSYHEQSYHGQSYHGQSYQEESPYIKEVHERIYNDLSKLFTNLPVDILNKCVIESIEYYLDLYSNFEKSKKIRRFMGSEDLIYEHALECIQKIHQTVRDVMIAIMNSRERPLSEEVTEFCLELAQLPSRPLDIIGEKLEGYFTKENQDEDDSMMG